MLLIWNSLDAKCYDTIREICFHSGTVIQAHDLTLYIQEVIVSGSAHCCKEAVFYEYNISAGWNRSICFAR
jgi:hypothetical protein